MKREIFSSIVLMACVVAGCADKYEFGQEDNVIVCTFGSKTYYCHENQLCCDGECIEPNVYNCGACDATCKDNEKCARIYDGSYACVCAENNAMCSATCCSDGCKQTDSDDRNCGGCGNVCGVNKICVDGRCRANCPTPYTACESDGGAVCVDIKQNVSHCGGCFSACPDAQDAALHLSHSYCEGGSCVIQCREGFENADGDMSNGCEKSLGICGNGEIERGELCDGKAFEGKDCSFFMGKGATGTPICNDTCDGIVEGSCKASQIDPELCGNGRIDKGEACDGDLFPENKNTCEAALNVGMATGSISCAADCSKIDTSRCIFCGDGIRNGNEECDGSDMKYASCAEVPGFASGTLQCNLSTCKLNYSGCVSSCLEGEVSCGSGMPQTIRRCSSGKFVETPCSAPMPFCLLDSGKASCVACLVAADCSEGMVCDGQSHQCVKQSSGFSVTQSAEGFEWISKANSSYTNPNKMPDTVGFSLTAVGATDFSNTFKDYIISGKYSVILRTDSKPESKIEVTGIEHGVGVVAFKAKAYDNSVTLSVVCGGKKDDQKLSKETGVREISITCNDESATGFEITSVGRVSVDDLSWTTGT